MCLKNDKNVNFAAKLANFLQSFAFYRKISFKNITIIEFFMFFTRIIPLFLLINSYFCPISNAQVLTEIEKCWEQKQVLVQRETSKVGKTRNLHLYTINCRDGKQVLNGVKIEYKLLISNQNRFGNEENNNTNYYETRIAFIDAEELEIAITALKNLQIQLNSPKKDSTELHYTSRSGMRIYANYNLTWEKWTVYIEFPDKKRNKISRNTLLELTNLLQQAHNKLKV